MKVVVISRTDAVARRREAVRQLADASLKFEFFDAIDSVSEAFRHFAHFDRRLFYLNTGRMPEPGEICCFASHKLVWKMCAAGREPFVVLEDDFQLAPDFVRSLREIGTQAMDYGFIRLQSCERGNRRWTFGGRPDRTPVDLSRTVYIRHVRDVPLCLVAYVIMPEVAERLAGACASLAAPVDKYMQKTWLHGVPIYGLSSPKVSVSSLARHSTIGPRGRKSNNPIFLFRRLLYKTMERIKRWRFDRKIIIREEARKDGFRRHRAGRPCS